MPAVLSVPENTLRYTGGKNHFKCFLNGLLTQITNDLHDQMRRYFDSFHLLPLVKF